MKGTSERELYIEWGRISIEEGYTKRWVTDRRNCTYRGWLQTVRVTYKGEVCIDGDI